MENLPRVLDEFAAYGVSTASDHTKTLFQTGVREKYLDCLVENIENRLQDVDILNAFNLFNPKRAAEATDKSDVPFSSYGQEHVDTLAGHFEATIDNEWSCMSARPSSKVYKRGDGVIFRGPHTGSPVPYPLKAMQYCTRVASFNCPL